MVFSDWKNNNVLFLLGRASFDFFFLQTLVRILMFFISTVFFFLAFRFTLYQRIRKITTAYNRFRIRDFLFRVDIHVPCNKKTQSSTNTYYPYRELISHTSIIPSVTESSNAAVAAARPTAFTETGGVNAAPKMGTFAKDLVGSSLSAADKGAPIKPRGIVIFPAFLLPYIKLGRMATPP